MKLSSSYLEDFISLFFPQLCPGCSQPLLKNEAVICTSCLYNLPCTDFHLDKNNRACRQLWGRVPFEAAASFLYFKKGSSVQHMLHHLKYNGNAEVGIRLGEMYGSILQAVHPFNTANMIIPVPLHPSKLRRRGYNQSELIASGLASSMGIPAVTGNLKRVTVTDSQTRKSRFSRYENMKEVFRLTDPHALTGSHILLVDDVLTTGATIEACALEILKAAGSKISIATLAFTD